MGFLKFFTGLSDGRFMKWFLNVNDNIQGPYPAEEIMAQLKKGVLPYSALVWAKGQVQWIPLAEWEQNFDQLAKLDIHSQAEQLWKLQISGRVEGEMNISTVLAKLKKRESLNGVLVSPQNENQWVPIYSSYMFMEALNLSRRNFLRAPLLGLAKVTRSNSRFSYVVKTATIGQGGLGVYGLGSNFEVGTTVHLKVESENLTAPLNVQGKVVYHTNQGFIGISMENISAEASSIILAYVKQFRESNEGSRDAA